MKRWNGWGSDEIDYHVTEAALVYLGDIIGPPQATSTVSFAGVLAKVPHSRLPEHTGVTTDPATRLRHARGHSLPDWVALRFGALDRFPDGVAYPTSDETLADLIAFAHGAGIRIIPYGGGTSVVGHVNPPPGEAPVLTVDLGRMARLHELDETDLLATFGAGVTGPHLEAQLRARGYTLGHFPQSFEYSTLGGWIATRSSGQQSLHYGRIEDHFAGGVLIAPTGRLVLPPFPASAAGPDLRHLVLGSEGRMGVLSQATVRIRRLPEHESFHAIFFPDWDQGVAAVRNIVQARIPMAMLRLSDAVETATILVLAGHEHVIALAERLLRRRGAGSDKCMLMFAVTGAEETARRARQDLKDITGEQVGASMGRMMGSEWRKSRFRTPYLRNALWEWGYAVDTLETALPWSAVPAAHAGIVQALRTGLNPVGERVHAFGHLSHLYSTGAGLYVTYLFRIAPSAEQTLARWQTLKAAASRVIVAHGGTISHQHGVGTDHLSYLPAEKGDLGMQALRDVFGAFDPDGIMNPGKLIAQVRL